MKLFAFLILALAMTACGKSDYTSVNAQPGETFVIEGNIDKVGGAMDPMVNIMSHEACVGGTPVRQNVEQVSSSRAAHTFFCPQS